MVDGVTGLLLYRVALPIPVANVYDAMAIDDNDGILFLITPGGIAWVNLSDLPSRAQARPPRSIAELKLTSPYQLPAREGLRQRNWQVRTRLRYPASEPFIRLSAVGQHVTRLGDEKLMRFVTNKL